MKRKYILALTLLFFYNCFNYAQTFIKEFHSVQELITIENQAYFVAHDNIHGLELWTSDGTKEGTFLIKDINTISSSNPTKLTVYKDEIYFVADDGVFGRKLWKTNGTKEGTIKLNNSQETSGFIPYPDNLTEFNNELYFTSNNGRKLWKTTSFLPNEIYLVYDFGYSSTGHLTKANGKLYFLNNRYLWQTDGSTSGTKKIEVDENPSTANLNSFNNKLFFITHTSNKDKLRFYTINSNDDIILLQSFPIPSYGDVDIHNFTQVEDLVYFSVTTDYNSQDDTDILWKTDGTTVGTVAIKSFKWDRHSSGSNTSNFIEYKNELFFNGGSQNNFRLWKSDGSDSGTVQALNFSISNRIGMFIHNNLLYYTKGSNLWSTDGTTENSRKISNLLISRKVSDDFFNIKDAENIIYFEADFEGKKALYTTISNPILEVKQNYSRVLLNKSQINFESKIDTVETIKFKIANRGNKDLVFSKIEIVAQDFYIDGNQPKNINNENPEGYFPKSIKPNEQFEFVVTFFPSTQGLKKGSLTIQSNDVTYPQFIINLIGFADDEIGEQPEDRINLDKQIIFDITNNNIKIDNDNVSENTPTNSAIGKLSVKGSNNDYSYKLTTDGNYSDNQYFEIDNNELKSNISFDFELKNTYVIQLKATDITTGNVIKENIIISITDVIEQQAIMPCPIDQVDMAYGLNDVTFVDNKTIIAVGTNGTIIKSDDRGDSWRKVHSEMYSHIYRVQFATDKIGYAIGEKILKTEDGGETWYPIEFLNKSNSFPNLFNIFFDSSEIGYVFDRGRKIYKTIDGGRYWNPLNLNGSSFLSGYFVNESAGYLTVDHNSILKTSDGGDTWESKALKISELTYWNPPKDIMFINEQIGFILAKSGEVIKTSDGGKNWKKIGKIATVSLRKIKFLNENIGYILGHKIYETTDGGITWDIVETNEYGDLHGIGFNDDGNIAVVGHAATCCIGSTTGSVIQLKNSNDNWITKTHVYPDSYGYNAIDFKEKEGYVFSNYVSSRTENGGVTWQDITAPIKNINQIKVINDNIYVIGGYNLYKSTDKGNTWTTISETNTIRNFFFVNEQIIYGNSSGRGVFKSVDGGKTWINVNPLPSSGTQLYFKNENEGYSVGYEGVFKTVDGGGTWNKITLHDSSLPERANYAIDFFNNIGVVGNHYGLFKSTDDGKTWVNTNSNLGGVIKFIHVIDELEWLVATENRVWKTINGGITWTSLYYNNEIIDTHFDNGTLYLAGYRNLTAIGTKSSSNTIGFIDGDVLVSSQSKEEYSIIKKPNNNYKWTVTGNNEIVYNDNRTTIKWNKAGTYTITVTSLDDCSVGSSRELTVVVEDVPNPSIEGAIEVAEFALNNEYYTKLTNSSRYNWFVNGHQNFNSDNNNVTVDWGEIGIGEIEVIETSNNSGTRKSAKLLVTIGGVLDVDDFNNNDKLVVYPNPVESQFSIDIENVLFVDTAEVKVFDMTGRLVIKSSYNKNINLNLDGIPPGVYVLTLNIGQVKYSKKIIKI